MRQRTTFLHDGSADFEPTSLEVTDRALTVKGLKAAREDRLTFRVDELPEELQAVLSQCRELHIRWTSPEPYASISPLVSRISPGLHTFMTPRRRTPPTFLCGALKKAFSLDLKCESVLETFIYIPQPPEKPPTSPAFQYHQVLSSLDGLITYIQHKICPKGDRACHDLAQSLSTASYIDLNYDSAAYEFTAIAFRSQGPDAGLWNEEIPKLPHIQRLEVGVLAGEKATHAGEISLGGWLTVIGDDKKPKPTLFSFPSRHHPLLPSSTSTFTASFPPPTGLHPTLLLSLPSPPSPPTASSPTNCTLHAYLTLPPSLFADKYQLSDPLFLASKNLAAIRDLHGATDLEAPEWTIPVWGSALLLDLAVPPPSSSASSFPYEVSIPLHTRYLPPTESTAGISPVDVAYPALFWACPSPSKAKDVDDALRGNPFDRRAVGYDALFATDTLFYHYEPVGRGNGSLVQRLEVPVLDLSRAGWVEAGTVAVVVLGAVWIVWKLVCAVLLGRGSEGREKEKEKERKRQ